MPSHLHEVLTEMVRHRPAMVVTLLSGPLKQTLPDWERVWVEAGDLTEITPTEYRADSVVVFGTERRKPVLAVVCEVQLSRDQSKWWSWPAYVANLRARLRCPTLLLVICPDPSIGDWCDRPVYMGHPGLVLRPLVVGPGEIPVVTDPDQAGRNPELAVLSAIAYGDAWERNLIIRAAVTGLQTIDQEHRELYTDLMLAMLPEAARQCLEDMVNIGTYEPQSDFFRRKIDEKAAEAAVPLAEELAEQRMAQAAAEATVETEVAALLAVLSARDIEVPDDARVRITGADPGQLDAWIRRAATASSLADVFD